MELKIIGGTHRGRKFVVPPKMREFRPTKNRVREAVTNSLNMDIPGASVCELCAGSGIFSFEMVSRGAESVVAVELDRDRANFIAQSAQKLDLTDQVEVHQKSAVDYIKGLSDEHFDIIFFDPPYYVDELTALITTCLNHLAEDGVLVFEYASDDSFVKNLSLADNCKYKDKKYGNSTIRYIRFKE